MDTASTAAPNLRDTASDAREGLREVRNASAEASNQMQSDLQKLRDDFVRLAAQVGDIAAGRGSAAWQRARGSVDGLMADAHDRGREALGAVREVSDSFVEAIDDSIAKRPYTTLGLTLAVGFLLGVTWRR